MRINARIAAVRATCWALAALTGALVMQRPEPARMLQLPVTQPKRIRMAAPPKPAVAAARESMPVQAKAVVLPKRSTRKVDTPVEAPPAPAPEPVATVAAPALPVQPLFMEQPGLDDRPPVPPNDEIPLPTHLEDRPGGDILVLALQVNSANVVVATDILVASKNAVQDLALSLSLRGTTWRKLDPPIPAGQVRWVEFRVDYSQSQESILP